MKDKDYKISASLICADQGNIRDAVEILESENVPMLHVDAMDGMFVPRYGMYPEQVESVREQFSGIINVHTMVMDPEPFIEWFGRSGADIITIHAEPNLQLGRTILQIKNSGLKAGVCLNIATPISVLEEILPELDLVMLMAIHPGILGQGCWDGIYTKISRLRRMANEAGNKDLIIEIDGGVKPETAPRMVEAGADALTCGTGTIFRPHEGTLNETIQRFRKHMKKANKININEHEI